MGHGYDFDFGYQHTKVAIKRCSGATFDHQFGKMKMQLTICLVLLATCTLADVYNGDGQPGCKTQEELDIGVFRDNWDPTAYWKCEILNEPASKLRCPSETGFIESLKDCVSWEDWKWEKPVPPLSEVDE